MMFLGLFFIVEISSELLFNNRMMQSLYLNMIFISVKQLDFLNVDEKFYQNILLCLFNIINSVIPFNVNTLLHFII